MFFEAHCHALLGLAVRIVAALNLYYHISTRFPWTIPCLNICMMPYALLQLHRYYSVMQKARILVEMWVIEAEIQATIAENEKNLMDIEGSERETEQIRRKNELLRIEVEELKETYRHEELAILRGKEPGLEGKI